MAIVATNKSALLLDAIRELARYRKEDSVATAFNVGNSFFATNEQWRSAVPDGCDGSTREPETAAEIKTTQTTTSKGFMSDHSISACFSGIGTSSTKPVCDR